MDGTYTSSELAESPTSSKWEEGAKEGNEQRGGTPLRATSELPRWLSRSPSLPARRNGDFSS